MRVLFLDFDGVLNTTRIYAEHRLVLYRTLREKWLGLLCPDRVALVDRVCREAGAVVVVSSSWQYRHPLDELRSMLFARGLTVPVVGATTGQIQEDDERLVVIQGRGREIRRWLGENKQVTHYAILDDMPELGGGVDHKLVRTYFDHGVTEDCVPTLLRLLGAGEGGDRE